MSNTQDFSVEIALAPLLPLEGDQMDNPYLTEYCVSLLKKPRGENVTTILPYVVLKLLLSYAMISILSVPATSLTSLLAGAEFVYLALPA